MIKCYINVGQLDNFINLKEPVQLVLLPLSDNYVEVYLDIKKVDIINYRSYSTIELKSRKKKWRALWRKIRHPRKKI